MSYYPSVASEIQDVHQLRQYSEREFQLIAQALQETRELELRPSSVPPARPRTGMIVYADGSNWDPGEGAQPYYFDGTLWKPISTPSGVFRERLNADTIFYVNNSLGTDDDLHGTSSGAGAWDTIQFAVRWLWKNVDANGYKIQLQVAAGTYNESVQLYPIVGVDWGGYSSNQLRITGDTTSSPSTVILNTNGSGFFGINNPCAWKIEGFKFTGTGNGLYADYYTRIYCGLNQFLQSGYDLIGGYKGSIEIVDSWAYDGNKLGHIYATYGAQILSIAGITCAAGYSAGTAFGDACARAVFKGEIYINGTFSGASTGVRYSGQYQSQFVVGGAAGFFPGSVAGAVDATSEYL